MTNYDTYSSPLASRNASKQMLELWSPRHKFNTWRRIWLAVAEAQHELTRGSAGGEDGGTGAAPVTGATGGSGTGETPLPPGAKTRELVTKEQVEELRAVVNRPGGITDAEMQAAEKYERELRHDVMAHVHALGDSCPKAKGIIHLGMTSQDVVCNADLLTLKQAINLITLKVSRCIGALADRAFGYRALPALGFTHYQPAQPTTVGRRCAGWAAEMLLCQARLANFAAGPNSLPLRGMRGATGTQASFLALLGDAARVDRFEAGAIARIDGMAAKLQCFLPQTLKQKLASRIRGASEYIREYGEGGEHFDPSFDNPQLRQSMAEVDSLRNEGLEGEARRVAREIIEASTFSLTGQTYPRVIDTFILADLASCASVLHKIATDIRLLSNRKELDEPFESKQIGSSAMPYKRNPMRCERICGLTRFVMNLVGNAYDTAATQWLERTLDDSSNRRLSLPEAFLALDGALDLMHNVASGLIVHEAMVRKNLMAELPFMATENILMACVQRGGDRQEYHELLREHAQAAGYRVKHEGLDNDLLERLQNDKHFWSIARGGPLREELEWNNLLDPMKYIGRSVEQTERFINDVIEPLREQYAEELAKLEENAPRV